MRPCGTFDIGYAQDMAIVRTRLQWVMWMGFLVFLFSLPAYCSESLLTVIYTIAVSVVAVFGLYILTGLCGQLSVGHAAFIGVGAFTTGILASKFGWPFWAAIPCAGLSAGIGGVVFGLPSLRIKGFYLAMATLAAQFIIMWIIRYPAKSLTGGPGGLTVPYASLGNIIFDNPRSLYYLIMLVTVIMGLSAKNISRTRPGRAFIAIRDNDLAAEVMGINLVYYKLLAFFLGCFYAGVAGSLWAYYMIFINPFQFSLDKSVWYVGMLIVGGMGSATGAIFGTITLLGLGEILTVATPAISRVFPDIADTLFTAGTKVLFGVIIVLFLIFEPRGISHRWEIFKASYRLHPYTY